MNKDNYRVIDSSSAELGRFSIILDTVEKDGELYPYSFVNIKKCVCILPILGDKILLIKQYRHALDKWLWEIPGGGIEDNEDLLLCAKRELLEETGCKAASLIDLGCCYPSPGATTEVCYMFAAECNKVNNLHLEPLELITTQLFTKSEMDELVDTGEFAHAAGIVAWHKYKLRKER